MRRIPKLPRALEDRLQEIGEGVKIARLRRGWTLHELADKAGVSYSTVRAVENGQGSTAIGNYMKVLWVLGLTRTTVDIASPELDDHGLALAAADRRKRARGARGRMSNDF